MAEFDENMPLDSFGTTVFTEAQIARFSTRWVRVDHYIKAGSMYFQPNRCVWGFINWTPYPDRG